MKPRFFKRNAMATTQQTVFGDMNTVPDRSMSKDMTITSHSFTIA